MLIDLHVHTSRYSACGHATPEEMLTRAAAVGLEGIVFTEHHVVWPDDEIAALREQFPQLTLFQGIEVTSAESDDLLLYGLTCAEDFAREPDLHSGTAGARLVSRAHELGLVVVLAHPYRLGDSAPSYLAQAPVDGVEIMSSNILNYAHGRAVALAQRLGAFPSAASDGHILEVMGLYGLRFEQHIPDMAALVRALNARSFHIHVDQAALAAKNAEIAAHRDELERMVQEGASDTAIHDRFPHATGVILRAVRRGLDCYRPGGDGVAR